MKLQKYNNKFLKLKILKTQIVNKKNIFIELKKILKIIYKFHLNNKKILFVVDSILLLKKFRQLFKNTNHICIFKPFFNKKINFYKFLTDFNLIIVFNQIEDISLLNNMCSKKIPFIIFNENIKYFVKHNFYNVSINFNFIYILVKIIFKKLKLFKNNKCFIKKKVNLNQNIKKF